MPAELSLRTRRPSRPACAGRYHLVEGQKNSKGQPLNPWDVNTGRDAKVTEVESMWPYVCDLQRDFAARVQWAATPDYNKAEHEPELSIEEGTDFTAAPGEALTLTARAKSPDAGLTDEISFKMFCETDRSVLVSAKGEQFSRKEVAAMQNRRMIRCSRIAAAAVLSLALMTGCGSSESASNLTTTYVEDIPADDPYYQQYLQSHGGTVSGTEATDTAAAGQSQSTGAEETQVIATPEADSQATGDNSASSESSGKDEETTDAASGAGSTEAAETTASSDASSAASSSADPNVGTVTGTVSAQSNSSQIFLSTDEDELEFQFNSSTDISECSGITAGKKLTITYSTDDSGLLVATKVADAQ